MKTNFYSLLLMAAFSFVAFSCSKDKVDNLYPKPEDDTLLEDSVPMDYSEDFDTTELDTVSIIRDSTF